MPVSSVIDSSVLAAVNGSAGNRAQSTSEELNTNFLTLLITQLKNQDPLKPMENTELTTQLAQINTVSGIDSLNQTMKNINTQIGAGQQLQATALIGRGVMLPGNQVLVGNDGVTTPFGIELARPAAKVSVAIVSESGEPVRNFELGASDTGAGTLVWDGMSNSGEQAAGGSYRVQINAVDADGEDVESTTLRYAVVRGVSVDGSDEPVLDIGGISAPVRLGEVRQIL